MVRSRLLGLVFGLAVFPALAAAEGTVQPKYPPSFDCSAVPAGSQRQACNSLHLDPPMGAIPKSKRTQPNGITLPQPQPPNVPTDQPPTIPRLPGTIQDGN